MRPKPSGGVRVLAHFSDKKGERKRGLDTGAQTEPASRQRKVALDGATLPDGRRAPPRTSGRREGGAPVGGVERGSVNAAPRLADLARACGAIRDSCLSKSA